MGDGFCPICGARVGSRYTLIAVAGQPAGEQHRCRAETLRGIDAARGVEDRESRRPTYGERLAQGFAALNQALAEEATTA